jgi:hypothetical protein
MRWLVIVFASSGGGGGGSGECRIDDPDVRTSDEIHTACSAQCEVALACRDPNNQNEDFECEGACLEYTAFAEDNGDTCASLVDAIVACFERLDCDTFETADANTATDAECAAEIACADGADCFL